MQTATRSECDENDAQKNVHKYATVEADEKRRRGEESDVTNKTFPWALQLPLFAQEGTGF